MNNGAFYLENQPARFSWQLHMIGCCKAMKCAPYISGYLRKAFVVFPTDLYYKNSSTSVLTHIIIQWVASYLTNS